MERFERDGLVFEVLGGGPAGGGASGADTVVLLHGFPQDNRCYDQVVPHLHAAGLRTLAPLQRGYSPGARPAGRLAYRVGECAADVVALLDQAGLAGAHVVGHDWGGVVAWYLAEHHPERLRSLTVLSMPHPRAMLAAMLRSSQGLRSAYIAYFLVPRLPEWALPRTLRRALLRSGLPEPSARRYVERLREPGALTAALNWYRAVPGTPTTPGRPIRLPTTYAWGRHDQFLGRTAAELTGRYVHGPYQLHVLDGGHWLPETHPAEVAALVTRAATG